MLALPPLARVTLSLDPLVSIVGRHVRLSAKARQAIERDLAEALAQSGVEVASIPAPLQAAQVPAVTDDPVMTTEEAARLVGVSRPFMVKLIDTGAVALHQRVGNQRRVLRSAVQAWQACERSRQVQALKRVAADLDDEIFGEP
jgi:excisionase family DNA binding protein